MARWQDIPAIDSLQRDLDARWPNRTRPDWTIGDADHSSRLSDHNPAPDGDVHAIDIRLGGDLVPRQVLNAVIGDPRVKYVIFNRVIYSRTYGWEARHYSGTNPHTTHIHVSFRYEERFERDTSPWGLGGGGDRKPTAKWGEEYAGKPGTRTLRRWSVGDDVEFVQRFLGIEDDGYYGPGTVRAVREYQQMRGLKIDGVVADVTWRHLLGGPAPKPKEKAVIDFTSLVQQARRGGTKESVAVRRTQQALNRVLGGENIKVDGWWGPKTRAQYGRWQWKKGYRGADADGIPGEASLRALCRRGGYRFQR